MAGSFFIDLVISIFDMGLRDGVSLFFYKFDLIYELILRGKYVLFLLKFGWCAL